MSVVQSFEPAAKEWLTAVAKPSGPIVAISTKKFGELDRELRKALGLKQVKNGFRNSYASYGQSVLSPGAPGQVAKSMGDKESTVKRWYVETLEPGEGYAWFGIRPDMGGKIIPDGLAGLKTRFNLLLAGRRHPTNHQCPSCHLRFGKRIVIAAGQLVVWDGFNGVRHK